MSRLAINNVRKRKKDCIHEAFSFRKIRRALTNAILNGIYSKGSLYLSIMGKKNESIFSTHYPKDGKLK